MTFRAKLAVIVACVLSSALFALARGSGQDRTSDLAGYVLKRGQGEILFGGNIIIKASPDTGSRTAMMATTIMAEGGSTGLHYHELTDELFFVANGTGDVVLGEERIPIEEGDSIFVPAGIDHKDQKADEGEPLELIFFTERRELADEFRESHRINNGAFSSSLETLNAISQKYGTVYKTLD